MSVKWWAVYGVFGAVLLLYSALIAAAGDEPARTRLAELAAFIVLPALVFAVAALPLQRGWGSRTLLMLTGVVAALVAAAMVIVTWGITLPIAAGLIAVAIADFERVLTLSGWRENRTVLLAAAFIVVAGAVLGLAGPVALGVVALALGLVVWRLRPGVNRREGRGPGAER